MRRSVCVDLDATLARYDKWEGVDRIGEPLPGAVEFTKQLAEFADVVIYTTRGNPEIHKTAPHFLKRQLAAWLDEHGFAYHHIYTEPGKPIASAFVDDRAVECRPQEHPGAYLAALERCRDLCERL